MIIILGFYSTSFLLRFTADKWILPYVIPDEAFLTCIDEDNRDLLCSPFIACTYTLSLCFVWDFFPIGAILLFHRRNFAKTAEGYGDGSSRSISIESTAVVTTEERIK